MKDYSRCAAGVRLCLLTLALGTSLPAIAQSLPTTVFGTGPAVTPQNAWSYYQTQSLTSPTWTQSEEIKALAAALGNDPDRIYSFVHDQVEVVWLFGVKAGARGALIDKAGTPFDQAQLMLQLLEAAGYSSHYQLGTITLSQSQFGSWTGIDNAAEAMKFLQDGGFPYSISASGSTINSVTLMHMWVRTTIGGSTYSFDPAFKLHTTKTGVSVDSAANFSSGTFFSRALSGSYSDTGNGIPKFQLPNRANIQADLQASSTTLLNHIRNNFAHGAIDDVLGGRRIVPFSGPALRQTSLPHQSGAYATYGNDIPAAFRTKVTISFNSDDNGGTTHTFDWFADEVYGSELAFTPVYEKLPTEPDRFRFAGGGQSTAWLTGTIPTPTITVNHPYAALAGAYMDRAVSIPGNPSGSLQVMLGFGRPSKGLSAWQQLRYSSEEGETLRYYTALQEEATRHSNQAATRRRMAAGYLAQASEAAKLIEKIGSANIQVHDTLGYVSGNYYISNVPNTGPAATTFNIGVETAISATAKNADAAGTQAAQRAYALMTPTLEGSLAEQMGGAAHVASTPAKFDWAVNGSSTYENRWFLYADSSNWNTVSNTLLNDFEGGSLVRNLIGSYIAAGYVVLVPRSSNLGPGPAQLKHCNLKDYDCLITGPERGGAFIAYKPDGSAMSHMIALKHGSSKGGGGTSDAQVSPDKLFGPSETTKDREFNARADAHDVDLKSGVLTYTPPADLIIGSGPFPYSLSFQRSYRSGTSKTYIQATPEPAPQDDLFGNSGWISDFTHRANPGSDGISAFGGSDPRHAASTIVALRAVLAMSSDGATALEQLQRQVIANLAAHWWTTTVRANSVSVNEGHNSRSFVKLADGSWAGSRSGDESAVVYNNPLLVTPSVGPAYWTYLGMCVRVTSGDGSTSYFGEWDPPYSSCPAATTVNRYANDRFSGLVFKETLFPNGVAIKRTAAPGTVTLANNLGRSINYTGNNSPQSFNGSLSDSASRSASFSGSSTDDIYGEQFTLSVTDTRGQTWSYSGNADFKAVSPLYPAQPFANFIFEPGTNGKVQSFSNANGHTTTYKLGSMRAGATVNALNGVHTSLFDEQGNPIAQIDPLGRLTKTIFDPAGRVSRVVAPEGNAVEYTYDVRGNRTSECKIPKERAGQSCDTSLGDLRSSTFYLEGAAVWSCANQLTCNKPSYTIDARGGRTDFTWSATHGQLLSITPPADNSGVRPQITYAYTGFTGTDGRTIYLLTSKTQKITATTSTVTTYGYRSTAPFTLREMVVDSGGLSLRTCYTHDAVGNVTSVTEPKAGLTSCP